MKRNIIVILCVICLAAMLPVTVRATGNDYTINGVTVRWDDFTSRSGHCRAYAEKMYEKIWGQSFSNSFYEECNMLRNLSKEELTLTEEHLKAFVTAAEIGSTIRASSARFLHRNDGNQGHSQIIVQKDENGFTVLEGGMQDPPYCGENYYTWSDYVNAQWLGGRYGYIKYIKWPGALAFHPDFGKAAPTVSGSMISREDGGFTVTYQAQDDLKVENAFVMVWSQSGSEARGRMYECDFDGETASVSVAVAPLNDVKNYYVRWYATDGNGNVTGSDEPRRISFYTPDVNCLGICKVTAETAAVRTAPYETVNGKDTLRRTVSRDSSVNVVGVYRNINGERWYLLDDEMWISEADVRYDTFFSLLEWLFRDHENRSWSYVDGQLLFAGD